MQTLSASGPEEFADAVSRSFFPLAVVGVAEQFSATIRQVPLGRGVRVAVHFDVDVVDSDEIVLGLGAEPNGLTSGQVRRVVADVQQAADVVGLTIAEFIPGR